MLTGGRHSFKNAEFAAPLYFLNDIASKNNILIVFTTHFKKPEFIIEQYSEAISFDDINWSKTEKGFVYFVRNQDIYKIGITDNLLRRFNQLKPDEILNVVRYSNYENLKSNYIKYLKNIKSHRLNTLD